MFGEADPRAAHLRRVDRARRSARRWAVAAATLAGSAAVAVPYAGIGMLDIVWAGAATGSLAVLAARRQDARTLERLPLPPPPAPRTVAPLPAVRALRRLGTGRLALHGSAAAGPSHRLDRAAAALPGLLDRLGHAQAGRDAAVEAQAAERALRDLAGRVLSVEQAVRVAPAASREALQTAAGVLVARLREGVDAYEGLVGAAAGCVAASAAAGVGLGADAFAVRRLEEAADALAGLSRGLAEVGRLPSLRDSAG